MVRNTRLVELGCHYDKYGCLVPVESEGEELPFRLNRIYYIYQVQDGVRRGFHSHVDLEQMLICVSGQVKIQIKTPFEEEDILLDDPRKGLYIGPMVWREMYDFSPDAVLLVLASKHYDVNDYIRDYEEYEKMALLYFAQLNQEGKAGPDKK